MVLELTPRVFLRHSRFQIRVEILKGRQELALKHRWQRRFMHLVRGKVEELQLLIGVDVCHFTVVLNLSRYVLVVVSQELVTKRALSPVYARRQIAETVSDQ